MSEHHSDPAACTPPSAAGHLEPYGARLELRTGSEPLDTEAFLIRFLEDLAASCVASGASLIGHLKCVLRTKTGALACNLTSVRSGAACSAAGEGAARTLAPGTSGRLDVAVLVYGLPARTPHSLLDDALTGAVRPLGASWRAAPEAGGSGSRAVRPS
jgi:hypothetical protein